MIKDEVVDILEFFDH